MHISHFLDAAVLLSLANSVSSSPIAQGATPNCATGDIAVVKRTVNEPAYFCAWWDSETRTTSPFLELTASKVNNACKCIVASSKTTSKNKRAASPSSAESCMAELSEQFTQPYGFCKFYNAVSRTTSPFRKYSAQSLISLCKCVKEKPTSSGTQGTSTKKTSSTKTTNRTSSTKAITEITSVQSPTSKKTTSSSSKMSTSSSKRTSSTSSRRSTGSSPSKKTSSTANPTSTSKSSRLSLSRTTSSSRADSSTKKISSSSSKKISSSSTAKKINSISTKTLSGSVVVKSSSTLTRTVSSTSSRSISKSSSSTLVKPLTSTKSSAKVSSSIQPSVATTSSISSTKLSSSRSLQTTTSSPQRSSSTTDSRPTPSLSPSVPSALSSTTQSSSTAVISTTAVQTPTARTDGQFYLRAANTTTPPSGYYITWYDGYAFRPFRDLLFEIESNGYLYQPAQQGSYGILDPYWPVAQFYSRDNTEVRQNSELGQYTESNLRCTYNEKFLLTCFTEASSSPVTFAWHAPGGTYRWWAITEESNLPTLDIYVEFVVPSTSTTTSSSRSTTSASSS